MMQNWIERHGAALWVIFPCFFVALWLCVSYLISYVGGWTELAKHFQAKSKFLGPCWRWQSAGMRGTAHYRGCLTLGCDAASLYLAVMPLFRFRHPALIIPWQEISVTRGRVLLFQRVELRLGRRLGIPLRLKTTLASKLEKAAGSSWPEGARTSNSYLQ